MRIVDNNAKEVEKMEVIAVTEEMLLSAREYVPLAEKERFVSTVATNCFDKLSIGTGNAEKDGAMPPYYKENYGLKARYLMAALAELYFGVKFFPASEADELRMLEEQYEAWASGNPLNQIESIKHTSRDPAVKSKCFDLLSDYRTLEKMLNAECYGLLKAMNDPVTRFSMLMEAQTTPEYVQSLMDSVSETQKELESFREKSKFQKVTENA